MSNICRTFAPDFDKQTTEIMKKNYIQPQTDFVRTVSGEVIMTPITDNFGSGTGPTNAPVGGVGNAPKRHINILYI